MNYGGVWISKFKFRIDLDEVFTKHLKRLLLLSSIFQKTTKNPVKNYLNYLSFFKKLRSPFASTQFDPKGRIVVNGYEFVIYSWGLNYEHKNTLFYH